MLFENLDSLYIASDAIAFRIASMTNGPVDAAVINTCLLNLYHTGNEGMAWHRHGEIDLKKNGAIGSLSFGVDRNFHFKYRQAKEKVSICLEHGSLLVMKDTTQTNWLHRLPPIKVITRPRINPIFRTITNTK